MVHAPRTPAARVGRAPDRDRRRADSRSEVHWSGIISNIQTCTTNDLGKLPNTEPKHYRRAVNFLRSTSGKGFFTGSGNHHDPEIPLSKVRRDLAEPFRVPTFCRHHRGGMYDDVRSSRKFLAYSRRFNGMDFVPQR